MKFKGLLVVVFLAGLIAGSVVVPRAMAQSTSAKTPPAPPPKTNPTLYEYKVVTPSVTFDEYEGDLNSLGSKGWRYVGALSFPNRASALVFERPR